MKRFKKKKIHKIKEYDLEGRKVTDQQIISMQMIYYTFAVVCMFLAFFGVVSSSKTTHILMLTISLAEIIMAYIFFKYFQFEVEDISFPGVYLMMTFVFLDVCGRFDNVVISKSSFFIFITVGAAVAWLYHKSKDYIEDLGDALGILVTIVAVLSLTHCIASGINDLAVTEVREIEFTIEDMDFQERTSRRPEYYCLYVTNNLDGYNEEPIEVTKTIYESHKIGDKIVLEEKRDIFNTITLTEPSIFRGAILNLSEPLGSDTAADIALIAIALAIGLIVAEISINGWGVVLFFGCGAIFFIVIGIISFTQGYSWWVWSLFGLGAAGCLWVLLLMLI